MTIPESDLKAEGDGARWKPGPAVAIWIVASLFGVVAFAVVLAVAHAFGQEDSVAEHALTLVMPRPVIAAVATSVAYVAQAYLAGFYVQGAFPAVAKRWIRFSAGGALFAGALAYWDAARAFESLRDLGTRVLDPTRVSPSILVALASAAAVGIAQAMALAPAGRRFLWWPFIAAAAGGAMTTLHLGARGWVSRPIAGVLGAALAGVVLGAGFVVLARQPDRRIAKRA